MKTINYTTTGSLFNHTGILTHAGDYAGKYQEEAIELINQAKIEAEDTNFPPENAPEFWADIMMNEGTGVLYAVWADGPLTSYSHCEYVEINENDCERAYKDSLQKIS